MNEHIIPLSDSHRCSQSVCGGKFAALAKIFSQDIPVPWGFSIGAEMYRNFLTANQLQEKILMELEVHINRIARIIPTVRDG